jgi:quaternary ammonium compound-resistance protein SugE
MMSAPSLYGMLWCALAGAASAGATFLIKLSHQAGAGAARYLWLLAACAVYGIGFVCYAQALKRLDISVAYPVMTAMTIATLTAIGTLVLAEALTPAKLLGLGLLMSGVVLIAR